MECCGKSAKSLCRRECELELGKPTFCAAPQLNVAAYVRRSDTTAYESHVFRMACHLSVQPALQWGLRETALLGGLVGGIVASQIYDRSSGWSPTGRRRGLFVRRRGLPNSRCPRCGGFRLQRCPLCDGSGLCICTRRYRRVIPCPQCMRRRYVACAMCHGSGRRPVIRSITPLNRRTGMAYRLRGVMERTLFWLSSFAARTFDSSREQSLPALWLFSDELPLSSAKHLSDLFDRDTHVLLPHT